MNECYKTLGGTIIKYLIIIFVPKTCRKYCYLRTITSTKSSEENFMGSIGAPEILIVAILFLLLFGAKRIPELARGLGQGIKEFRNASNDIKREIDESSRDINESVKGKETNKNS